MNNFTAIANKAIDSVVSTFFSLGLNPFSEWFYIQLAMTVLLLLAGWLVQRAILAGFDFGVWLMGKPWPLRRVVRVLTNNIWLIVFLVLCIIVRQIMLSWTWPSRSFLLSIFVQLAAAWLFINIVATLIRNQIVYKIVVAAAWIVAALNILGLLTRTEKLLGSVGIKIGELNLTPLLLIKVGVLLAFALWLVFALIRFLEFRLQSAEGLTPSVRVLIGQLAKFILIIMAIVIVLSSSGVDLSAFALFSGALGVGIGFGLQKIVSNFVSGLILLLDKSIKPGDVISVGESFGWVGDMGARYTSVQTREGREYLIPNEDLITNRVENWSFSNQKVRLDVKFGVAYKSDPHTVIRLAVEAVQGVPRILSDPPARCNLAGFGDSSLDFSLRFWISDPAGGIGNIRSEVYLAIWDIFKRDGIEIPYPVRDVRLSGEATLASRPSGSDTSS